jgi:glycosyltransferase involved in cell wall biosynthesis
LRASVELLDKRIRMDRALDRPEHGSLGYVLVIPAFNEQQAITGTLRRALAARQSVLANTPVTEMTIVVVNDGSTDETQALIDQPEFAEAVKVRFAENRGYGAAIKAGFAAAPGELVGFVDADGTCDPEFSVQLINRLLDSGADVVLANRLNPDSRMPRVRRIGNRLFSTLLNRLAGASVVDIASGFRVLRRSRLRWMYPLPDGLHFTPALSCVCVLDPRLRIEELPMPYHERIGQSKLSVVWDGFRFLFTILFAFCCYSPIKSALAACLAVAALGGLLAGWLAWHGSSPTLLAAVGSAFGVACVLLTWAGLIGHQLNYMLIGPRRVLRPAEQLLQKLLHERRLVAVGAGATMVGALGFVGLGLQAEGLSVTVLACVSGGLTLIMAAGIAALTCGVVSRVIWAVNEKQKAAGYGDYEFSGIPNPKFR